ncbi:aminotransferase class V-fold PLP-dependent enzyme [Jiulongibacter sediminis]|uniref:aminotransferase class V-fold PLP-dependent enzyme n=1 Tax=Jiulongibacter sediminis TaxID=1605367 RepID=UPI0026EB2D25|nr:aminotransferase class V-fold PLP-dependent enzyme [Jiulongibacter sediminis]
MITFYPGPSKIYPQVKKYLNEAFDSRILQMNHRSPSFMDLLKETIEIFKEKQGMPDEYEVFFTSSATEAWEILAQSVIRGRVQFLYNGAFGKKWFKYTVTNPAVEASTVIRGSRYKRDETIETVEFDPDANFYCAVQNETSNGTVIQNQFLKILPSKSLKCFDITSSLGAQKIDFTEGDFWLASVQKGLGLPSGMGILICSPKGLKEAEKVNERNHYNSLNLIRENFKKYQTNYTPNILNIFLLNRISKEVETIEHIDQKLKQRAADLYAFFEKEGYFSLVKNELCRSQSVLAFEINPTQLGKLKNKANEHGILLGNGYGEWKENSFRIANFPAITDEETEQLKNFIKQNAHEIRS